MNNREIDSKVSNNNREKRSYEFLMGLINNNSKYEVTNVDLPSPTFKQPKTQSAANEALLELMVKIAADPDQWEKVHTLLQKIDTDLKTSTKLLNKLQNSVDKKSVTASNSLEIHANTNKKKYFTNSNEMEQNTFDNNKKMLTENAETNNDSSAQMQKMTALLKSAGHQDKKLLRNLTDTAVKTNQWPRFEQTEGHLVYSPPDKDNDPKYPWQNKLSSKTYPRNFAYHRVTGNPFYHSSYDKNPKAYIAVSVIAPKPLKSRPQEEDLILENELRQLKPWTHKQNLKNMAAIRSRWVIQSDKDNENNSAL